MRIVRVVSLTIAAAAVSVALAPAALAAPEPCVTIQDPFHPGYTAPTCPVSVVRGLLP